jgi:hypothetical protein
VTASCNFLAAPARVRSIDGAEDAPFLDGAEDAPFLDVKGAEDDALGVWLFFFAFNSFPFCFMMTLNSLPLSGLVQ